MLYQIVNGTVSVGDHQILSHVDFEIKGKEKVAVVGRNGAGKTTLLRLLAGEIDLDRDDKRMQPGILASRKLTIGKLDQTFAWDADETVEEILLAGCPVQDLYSRERYLYETEYDRLFMGFGFRKEDKMRRFSTFSGGEQTKISLIRLLLAKPDLLLLDEPTNHLDIPTIEWLEAYMKEYEKAVIVVSHDRFFLDQVVDVVYELQNGKLRRYPGNYTNYRQQKKKNLALAKKAYESQQKEAERLQALIEKFKHKPRKASFARSRQSILDRMEKLEKPLEDEAHLFTGEISPQVMGTKWMLEAEHLKIGYDHPLLELSLRIRNGQKIGIIGDNGVGKTTFLKTAAGVLPKLGGTCILSSRAVPAYFDQQTASMTSGQTVLEHFRERFPAMTEKEARNTLAMYLFGSARANVRVSSLSGGEKSRLVLAEILCARPNFLFLDEPTNHMDMQAKETLESAFLAYTGTILFISHDRYFVQQVADALLVFDAQGVHYYPFGYAHYAQRKKKYHPHALAAMVQAEDQALISAIRSVPKGEYHPQKEMDTQQAYLDWKLRLAQEEMDEKREKIGKLWDTYRALQEEVRTQQWCLAADAESYQESVQNLSHVEKELQQAWDLWTNSCLKWYEIWDQSPVSSETESL